MRKPTTLGADLERARLTARAVRLEYVIAALRTRAHAYEQPQVPAKLGRSISAFERELDAVQARVDAATTGTAQTDGLLLDRRLAREK
jgi:hypothetical protein